MIGILLLVVGFAAWLYLDHSFLNPRASLNAHFTADFGKRLPVTAKVKQAAWYVGGFPTEAYEIDMPPEDAGPFVESIKALVPAAAIDVMTHSSPVHPACRVPWWWNYPAVRDPKSFIMAYPTTRNSWGTNYGFVRSEKTGKLFVYWGKV